MHVQEGVSWEWETFPQYMERELGSDVKFGLITSMNPLATVVLTIIAIFTLGRFSTMPAIILGMFITTSAAAWLIAGAAYWTGVLFAVTMSFGEAIWVPRFMELSLNTSSPDGEDRRAAPIA